MLLRDYWKMWEELLLHFHMFPYRRYTDMHTVCNVLNVRVLKYSSLPLSEVPRPLWMLEIAYSTTSYIYVHSVFSHTYMHFIISLWHI